MSDKQAAAILFVATLIVWVGFLSGVATAIYSIYINNAVLQFLSAIWTAIYLASITLLNYAKKEQKDD